MKSFWEYMKGLKSSPNTLKLATVIKLLHDMFGFFYMDTTALPTWLRHLETLTSSVFFMVLLTSTATHCERT